MPKKESKLIDLIGILLILIFVPVLIICIIIAVKANINHDKVPDFCGYKPLICSSNSMQNVFGVGDVTITKEIEEKDLNQGDIITFWDNSHDMLITHRINKIVVNETGKRTYITKGDLNDSVDEEVIQYEQIEGKYIYHIKYIGKVILAIQTPTGLIVAFLIPVIICALVYRHNLKLEKIKDARKQKLLRRIEERKKSNKMSS